VNHYDNYHSDHRVRAGERRRIFNAIDGRRMTATVTVHPEADIDEDVEVPIRYDVCPTCDGRGSHVNPSVDCDGLTAEDFAEDPDLAEMYMDGVYDVTCYGCNGRNVVPVIDEDRCDPEIMALVNARLTDEAAYRREAEAERRMGCWA
jgi:hypothetical protein